MRLFFLVLIAALGFACTQKKSGYVNIQTVFNDFEYKKELEKEVIQIQNNRKYILDSMQANLKMLSNKYNLDKTDKNVVAEFQTAKEIFFEKKSQIEEEEANMVRESDAKIIKQINSYMKEFGKENKYDIIFGATANGNIMYADSTMDITKEVTQYVNAKYKGAQTK